MHDTNLLLWESHINSLARNLSLKDKENTDSSSSTSDQSPLPKKESIKWNEDEQKLVNILEAWNGAKANLDEIMGKGVYLLLSEKKREPYEERLEVYETLEEDYGSGLKKASDLKNAIGGLQTLYKEVSEMVEFEQKVYDLTEMTSEQFPRTSFSQDSDQGVEAMRALKQRIGSLAESIGWKGVMKKATEVIGRVDLNNCEYLFEAISESGEKSLAKDFVEILSNKHIDLSTRIASTEALSALKDPSVAPDITNVLSDTGINDLLSWTIVGTLGNLNNRTVTAKLSEIHDNNQTKPEVSNHIWNLLQEWGYWDGTT